MKQYIPAISALIILLIGTIPSLFFTADVKGHTMNFTIAFTFASLAFLGMTLSTRGGGGGPDAFA